MSRSALVLLRAPHQQRRYSLNEFAVFKCTIKLTDAGVPRWGDIVALVVYYMQLMSMAGEDKLVQLYDEQTAIDTADFQFQSRQSEETYVDKISNSLLQYPPDLVLYGRLCCIEPVFDYAMFSQLLLYFCCSNMRVHLSAPLSQQPYPEQPWLTAPWYGTQYRVSSIADSLAECFGETLTSDSDVRAVLQVGASASQKFHVRS